MMTFICGLSEHFYNKENRAPLRERKNDETGQLEHSNRWALGFSFVPRKLTPDAFIQHVLSGGAFTVGQFNGVARSKKHFQAGHLLAMDIDNKVMVKRFDPVTGEPCKNEHGKIIKDEVQRSEGYVTYQQVVNHPLVQQYAMLVYPSPSCTEDWHKFRVVFRLSEPVAGAERWEALQLGLMECCKDWYPDQSCKDAARLYYGSTNRLYEPFIHLGNVLPLTLAGEMTHPTALEEHQLRVAPKVERLPVSGARADAYAAKTYQNLLNEMDGYDSRHDALMSTAAKLYSRAAGNWPGFTDSGIEHDLYAECVANGFIAKYQSHEFHRCLLDAREYGYGKPVALELPKDDEPATEQKTTLNEAPAHTTPKIEIINLDTYFDNSAAAILEVEKVFTGEQLSKRLARPFPFTVLHSFLGFAHIQEAGKLVYITGVSGGSKTSFAECLVEPRLKAGQDVLWFGPEWNAVEMQKRAIQRNGGVTFTEMSQHEIWESEKRRGIPAAERLGRPVSQADYTNTLQIIQQIKAWRGQMHQLRQHPDLNNMDKMIEAFERKCETLRKAGRTVTDFYFDYIQRAPMATRDWDKLEIAVSKIKSMCERLDLFGHILVQPTKGESKATRDGGDLTESSAQGLSDQQANLYLTLTPEFDDNGDKLPYIKVRVVKNSMGKTGMKCMKWAQRFLSIVDEEVKPMT